MRYWSGIAKRAAARAAKDLRLDSAVGVVIGVLVQAITGVLIYALLGQTDVNFWTRAATAGAPFLAYPLAFLIRMATEPATQHAEDQERLLAVSAATDRKRIRERFGALIEQVEILKQAARIASNQDHLEGLIRDTEAWREELMAFIGESLDASYRARILSDAGILSGEPTGLGDPLLGRWRWLNYRSIRLQEIAKEFS